VLWTGGAACLLLALSHELIDRRGWPALGAAYAGAWLLVCVLAGSGTLGQLYQSLFAGPLGPPLPPWLPSVAYGVTFTAVWWLLLRLVARRGWRWSI
jgi:predicted acyltransferase